MTPLTPNKAEIVSELLTWLHPSFIMFYYVIHVRSPFSVPSYIEYCLFNF